MKIRELENRKKELDTFEAQFQNEKKIFDTRIEEFNHWRDKLEHLEMEIEKRRQELMKQDQIFFKETQPVSLEKQSVEPEIVDSTVPATPDYHQILDKIPQSAAIVQRGILKQVNTSFAELIGYSMHEIMEKNFFDFVAVEGLAEIEKYYLNRLKGESITSYKTIFSTKENEKVLVEVTVKPTIYNGEKAEIAIITGLETQKHE
jgi:PAS domain S-box-containing protein